MSVRPSIVRTAALIAGGMIASSAAAQIYDFSFLPASSGLSGSANFGASTTGTLIGDWDEINNPSGTRTKPGFIGPFGPLENLPVPVSLGTSVGGTFSTQTAGGFRAALDAGLGTIQIDDYAADFLSSGPISLDATISLLYDNFRTRSPDSLYIGGFPLEIPIGSVELTTLSAAQNGPAFGTLSPIAPDTFQFNALVPVILSASLDLLGNPLDLGPIPFALAVSGEVIVTGNTATLTGFTPVEFESEFAPGVTLPQFPLPLPTILPPGGTANLLFDLLFDQAITGFDASLTTSATGVLIPTPASPALVLLAAGLAARRRRASAPIR